MVDIQITIGNEDLAPLEARIQDYMKILSPELVRGQDTPKVQSATIAHAFCSRLLKKIRDHQRHLEELARKEKEERDRIRAGRTGNR